MCVEAWDLGLSCSPGKSSSGVPEGHREMNGSWDEIWYQYLSVFLPFRHRQGRMLWPSPLRLSAEGGFPDLHSFLGTSLEA